MTAAELELLDRGDSLIGFHNSWSDEFPVVEVAPMKATNGRVTRSVVVRIGKRTASGLLYADGPEIRGPRFRAVPF